MTRSRILLTTSALTILLVFLTLVSVPALAQTQTQNDSAPQERAERLVEIAEHASAEVADLLGKAQDEGLDITTATSLHEGGLESLEAAKDALAAGNYQEAIDKAHEALVKFRESLTTLRQAWKDLRQERAATRLQSVIDKMQAFVQRLQERLDDLPPSVPPELVNEVKTNLNKADGQLNAAESNLKVGNIDQAIDHLKKAREDIKAALAGVREIKDYLKKDHITDAVARLTSATDRVETLLQRAADKDIPVADLQERLSTIRGLLSSAESKAAAGDFDGAVADLRQAASQIHATYQDLVSRIKGG